MQNSVKALKGRSQRGSNLRSAKHRYGDLFLGGLRSLSMALQKSLSNARCAVVLLSYRLYIATSQTLQRPQAVCEGISALWYPQGLYFVSPRVRSTYYVVRSWYDCVQLDRSPLISLCSLCCNGKVFCKGILNRTKSSN